MEDFLQTLAQDRAYRKTGIKGDLFQFDQIMHGKEWDYSYPTLVYNSCQRYSSRDSIDYPHCEDEFRARWTRKYPFLNGIDWTNLLIAGGCLQNLLLGESLDAEVNCVIDIDVFFVSLKTQAKALDRIRQFVSQLGEKYILTYARNRNALTIVLDHLQMVNDGVIKGTHRYHYLENSPPFQIQFIFRLYSSPSEVLHGFDLASSQVGFDGQRLWFTSVSKFAYEYGLNYLDTTRRSTSYEHRIVKYFLRGFGMIFPNLKLKRNEIESLAQNDYTMIYLPWCNLKICRQPQLLENQKKHLICSGRKCSFKLTFDPKNKSDHARKLLTYQFCPLCGQKLYRSGPKINYRYNFRLEGTFTDPDGQPLKYVNNFHLNENYWPENENWMNVVEDLDHPKLKNYNWLFERKYSAFWNLFNDQPQYLIVLNHNLEAALQNQLDLEDFIKYKFSKLCGAKIAHTQLATELTQKVLGRLKEFNEKNQGLPEFIIEDPGTQLTSSINPIMEAEWTWYGPDHYRTNWHQPDQFCQLLIDVSYGVDGALDILIEILSSQSEIPTQGTQYVENIQKLKDQLKRDQQYKDTPPRSFGLF